MAEEKKSKNVNETVLPLAAVEAMLENKYLNSLLTITRPKVTIIEIVTHLVDAAEDVPDWMIAGLNCTDPNEILPVCIHTFLMDWGKE